MIQRHRILINLGYTAQTADNNSSNLTTVGGYQVNNVQGLGGGIVNASNVRFFLNDEVNDIIINDFFSYLTASTTTVEFAEIYHSDQKLADVFNNYYVSSVLNNQIPPTSVIDGSLSGTSGFTVISNEYHNLDGVAPKKDLQHIPLSINDSTRILNVYSALTTYTLEQSYYIPVFIRRNNKQMARLNFKDEVEIISLIINGTTLSQEEAPVEVSDFDSTVEFFGGTYNSYNNSYTTPSYSETNTNPSPGSLSKTPPSSESNTTPTTSESITTPATSEPSTAPSEGESVFERFLK